MASTHGSTLPPERESRDCRGAPRLASGLVVLPAPGFPCKPQVFLLCVRHVKSCTGGRRKRYASFTRNHTSASSVIERCRAAQGLRYRQARLRYEDSMSQVLRQFHSNAQAAERA